MLKIKKSRAFIDQTESVSGQIEVDLGGFRGIRSPGDPVMSSWRWNLKVRSDSHVVPSRLGECGGVGVHSVHNGAVPGKPHSVSSGVHF